MMRQNMELQQRQSSLERRASYQKSLLAANRDQMQVSPYSPQGFIVALDVLMSISLRLTIADGL